MDLNDEDAGNAPHLLDVVMQNCRGRVDAYIGSYINLALTRLVLCKTACRACSRVLIPNSCVTDAARAVCPHETC
jgi:hypothetical protein